MIRPLFQKYQKFIVAFANTAIGRLYLHAENLPIVEVAPDGIHYLLGFEGKKLERAVVKAVFHSRSPYLEKFSIALTSLDIAMREFGMLESFLKHPDYTIAHFLGLHTSRIFPTVMLSTLTVNPDANPETTSVDGYVNRFNASGETFATIRAGAGNNVDDSGIRYGYGPYLGAHPVTTPNYIEMDRMILLFDTASLSAAATISAAVISVFGTNSNGFPGNTSFGTTAQRALSLVGSTPASNTSLATSDYANLGATKYATDFLNASYNDSAYNDITMNGTGLAAISKTGVTKLGFRTAADCDNSEPTWSVGKEIGFGMLFADNGSNKPKLVITYTIPVLPGKITLLTMQSVKRSYLY